MKPLLPSESSSHGTASERSPAGLWHYPEPMPRKEGYIAITLSEGEERELRDYENVLEQGLGTFFEVGNALLAIRDGQLYRRAHRTFEQYCQERWNIGRSYACRVIGAAQRVKLLAGQNNVPKPQNEFQVRPFLKLAPESFPAAWKQAVDSAKAGKITSKVVRAVIHDLLPTGPCPAAGVVKRDAIRKRKLPLGQILTLLCETKKRVEKGETKQAIESLERIENLLCGL